MHLLLADLVALVGGTVHSMVPGEVPRIADVLIRDGEIAAIGESLELPPGTERFDVSGKHLVPGLIDGMVNFDPQHDALYVAAGVTTVRDIGGERLGLLLERKTDARDRTPGPTLLTAGAVLDGDPPSSAEAVVVRDVAAAEGLLPFLLEDGVDFISIYPGLKPTPWRRLIELSHEADLEVWGPKPSALTLAETLDGGQDGLFYMDGLLPEGVDWRVVQAGGLAANEELLVARGTKLVPLLNASAAPFRSTAAFEPLLGLLSPDYEAWWLGERERVRLALNEDILEAAKRTNEKKRAALLRLHEKGVHLMPGSGSPHPWLFPGHALHAELAEWEAAGLPPEEILAAATRGAAAAMGFEDRIGSLAPEFIADVLVLNADPRESVEALRQPEMVAVRGRVLDRAALDDLVAAVLARQSKVRAELGAPIEIAQPPLPTDSEGSPLASPEVAVVLEGQVETYTLNQRLSAERFLVAREPDGRIHIAGRTKYPAGSGAPDREMVIGVTLDTQGRQESFRVAMRQGDAMIECFGRWTAGAFHLRRLVNGNPINTPTPEARPVCVDVGSVVLALTLSQQLPERAFPVLTFHEALEPELSQWDMLIDVNGDHHVRTHLGRMAWRFDERGAPTLGRTQVGGAYTETRLVQGDEWGGAGLPFPPAKLRYLAEQRALQEASSPNEEDVDEAQAAEETEEDENDE